MEALTDAFVNGDSETGIEMAQQMVAEADLSMDAVFKYAQKGQFDSVFDLIDTGFDVNSTGPQKVTVLHFAAMQGRASVVDRLLRLGADVNQRNAQDSNAVSMAILSGDRDTVELLIKNGADCNNKTADTQTTPLHLACIVGKNVDLLLVRGVDPNPRNYIGVVPLHYAVHFKHTEAIQLLLAHGATPTIQSDHGSSPLDLAMKDPSIMELFSKSKE
jgi:ankyrin repeat protein